MCCLSKRLSKAYDAWERIDAPNTVKHWVSHGVTLPFVDEVPCEGFYVPPYDLNNKEHNFVSKELLSLELRGAVKRVYNKPKCVSPIKCVPKKGGKLRLITDLRLLNDNVDAPHFQNEGINTAANVVHSGDYMCKTDLKDGFFHIPVYEPHQTYLGFEFDNVYYVWCVLPFGLTCSPYYFTKCLRPVVSFLRERPWIDQAVGVKPTDTESPQFFSSERC